MNSIAITGPECCGKTTLARFLAERFQLPLIPEFSRDYLTSLSRPYVESDLVRIARGQQQALARLSPDAKAPVFCDTDMTVMRVWSLVKFGGISPPLMKCLQQEDHGLYLLCYPDLPWEADPLRENREDRKDLFELYKEVLHSDRRNFRIIRGLGNDRMELAASYVSEFVENRHKKRPQDGL